MKKNIILCAGENGRAVIIGEVYEDPTPGEAVTLRDARMLISWSSECGGLLGFAANGPKTNTTISPAVIRTVATRWQEYIEISPEIAEKIKSWPAIGE